MTTATQHISPNPALDFAKGILEETNGALELIEILRDIADGVDEKATTNDRIAANIVLADRGLGKCPKQVSPSPGPSPDPDSSASSESPSVVPHNEPESPRIVTQIDNSLNQSIGPAPSAHTEPAHDSREKPALVPRHGGGNPESYDTSDSPNRITQTLSTPTLSISLFNSISSPSPTTARRFGATCSKSPGPKTTRRPVLSNAEGSQPTTAAGPPPSSSTASWAQTPTRSEARSAPNAAESGRPTPVHTIILSPIERSRLDVR